MEKLALKVALRWCFGRDEEGDSPHLKNTHSQMLKLLEGI